jgi:putative FmdB family regulatory protein
MPTYEYQCPDGHGFEKFQKMSDRPRAKCPACGKSATRKISGGAGLVFKGTGFYITDYGKDGKGPRKEGTEKTERAGKAEGAEAKHVAGEAPKPAPGKSEGKTEAASAKSAPGGKGKAAPE